jgi:drug/metabolite transporter (DMT)-like permease
MLRSQADVALLVLGVVLFVAGAVIMARPFVALRSTLFIAVPAAATAGLAVLGVLALVCAVLIALVESPSDAETLFSGISWPGGGPRSRRK